MLFYTARARRGIQELRRLGPQFRLRFLCSLAHTGASAPLGSAIRRRLPLVALLALPPYLGIGAGGILFGRAVIFASIPLSKQFRMLLGKGLMPNLFMMAYRAALAMDASIHCRLPCMPLLAFPPDPLAASGRHVLRGQRRIFLLIPLFGNFRMCGRKAVLCRGSVAGAIRAPISAQVPFGRCCLPLVPFFAFPPNSFAAPRKNLFRRQRRISVCVPIRCQLGRKICQRVSNPNLSVIAVRAGLFCAPALHLAWACLPLMPFFASPPHLFVGIRCNLLRSAAVFQRMP